MATAKVSITLTPREFDVLREQLQARKDALANAFTDAPTHEKSSIRQQATDIENLLRTLG